MTSTAVAISTSASAAGDPQILSAGGPTAVANSYLVVLKDTRTPVRETAQRLAPGKIGSVWEHAVRGFSVTASQTQALQIAADPAVAFVEQNHTVHLTDTQPNPPSWGLDRIDQRNLPLDQSYTYPNTASNVHAYIIDTGIRITHTNFGGRASYGADFIDNDAIADDCHGHGTHVAGTTGGSTFGVAKGVQLVAVRVLDCAGSGTFQQVIDGVNWVTANAVKPAVANMSLGGAGTNATLEAAVTASINSGVVFALAAGNSSSDACNFTPARTPAAITVGATDITDTRASFSNFGACLDLFGPGVNITSSWNLSDTATNTISGTSMASPHVAGAAALILGANPTFTAQQVRDAMVAAATPAKVINPGAGSPNLLLFVGAGGPPPTCTPVTNGTDVAIPDNNVWVTSSITISSCPGNAKAASTVEVHIAHLNRGDLAIQLQAPDGTRYQLKSRSNDTGDNLDTTYTVNLSSEVANGTWILRVRDRRANGIAGTLTSWTLGV
ncbi:serine protease [Rhizocola hellebori]|uniref:Serine protease n=2 Tax=Rhizocola hellebori TaxID=1392758 RepID=A0A8J3Q614_9ACTN|nr:S8 family serine peptidase [Rhizocola hellebori]GIH04456.1 serine protease [Rhizocola hellebori]